MPTNQLRRRTVSSLFIHALTQEHDALVLPVLPNVEPAMADIERETNKTLSANN